MKTKTQIPIGQLPVSRFIQITCQCNDKEAAYSILLQSVQFNQGEVTIEKLQEINEFLKQFQKD